MRFSVATLALLLTLGLALPTSSRAQMNDAGPTTLKVGPRVGVPLGDVSDFGGNLFFGAEGRARLASLPSEVVLNPSLDFYLTDDYFGSSLTVFALDLNALYELDLGTSSVVPYGGGGIAITRISVDVGTNAVDPSSTDVGLNVVGGARFPVGPVEPFAQFNFAAGADRIGLTGGVLFAL